MLPLTSARTTIGSARTGEGTKSERLIGLRRFSHRVAIHAKKLTASFEPTDGERRSAIERFQRFVTDPLPERPRVLLFTARHATGLSTALREVRRVAGDREGVAVIDDAQRLMAVGRGWFDPERDRRIVLGVDVDDSAQLA